MTRKFVYDPRRSQVRLVAWTTGSHAGIGGRLRPWRWLLVALVLGASAVAFEAAHSARARGQAAASR
jgi:hypothetical protein